MKKVYTTGQVARICKVAPRTVVKWFDSGRLHGYRIPGSQDRRIPRESLVHFLQEHNMPLGELEADAPSGAPDGASEGDGTGWPFAPLAAALGAEQFMPAPDAAAEGGDELTPPPDPASGPWFGRKVFTTGQVAKICRVSPSRVALWFDTGELQGYRIPGSSDRRIPRDALIHFLQGEGFSSDELESLGLRHEPPEDE